MELIALQCKNCGGEITIEDDKKIVYCPYCGTQNYIDDGTRTVKIVDEAKLEEVRLRQEEFLKRKASEEELNGIRDKKIKQRRIWRVFMVLAHILAHEEYGRYAEHKPYTRYAWISAHHADNNGCDKT